MITPKTHALAFRVWAFCKECEWNTTVNEIAEALDESAQRIGVVLRVKGWTQRIRVAERGRINRALHGLMIDKAERQHILRGIIGQTDVLSFGGDE